MESSNPNSMSSQVTPFQELNIHINIEQPIRHVSQQRNCEQILPYHYLMLDTTYKTLNIEVTFLSAGI